MGPLRRYEWEAKNKLSISLSALFIAGCVVASREPAGAVSAANTLADRPAAS
jgi:PBP1b-binding outer membrane lipoprotein LpoB